MAKLLACSGFYSTFAAGSIAFHREVWNRISESFSCRKKPLTSSSDVNLVFPSSPENHVPHSAFTACSRMHKSETELTVIKTQYLVMATKVLEEMKKTPTKLKYCYEMFEKSPAKGISKSQI